jgi:CMP-N,N'-diacetyllegionaminic acid synthase
LIVGIIPAKSGSKRLKNKNIKLLNNKPLVYWTIKYAKESKLLDKVYVSTNSKKIALMMKKYKVPVIIRPLKLCGEAPIIDVYKHAYKKINNQIKLIVGLQPDHPDRIKKLDDVIKIFKKKKADFLYSVDKENIKNGAHYILSKKVLRGGKIKSKVKIVDNCTNIHFIKDLKKAEKNIKKNEK